METLPTNPGDAARQILALSARLTEAEAEIAALRNVLARRAGQLANAVDGLAEQVGALASQVGNVTAEAARRAAAEVMRGEPERIRAVVANDLRAGRGVGGAGYRFGARGG